MAGSKLARSLVGFCWPLVASRTLGMDVLGEFVGGHDPILGSIGGAFESLLHVVGEYAVAAFEIGAFERLFAHAAGGKGEERLIEIGERAVEILRVFRRDGAAVAGIGEQDLPFLDLSADHRA